MKQEELEKLPTHPIKLEDNNYHFFYAKKGYCSWCHEGSNNKWTYWIMDQWVGKCCIQLAFWAEECVENDNS